MAETDAETFDLLRETVEAAWRKGWSPTAYVGKVSGYVGKGQPGSAMFRFGEAVGA